METQLTYPKKMSCRDSTENAEEEKENDDDDDDDARHTFMFCCASLLAFDIT